MFRCFACSFTFVKMHSSRCHRLVAAAFRQNTGAQTDLQVCDAATARSLDAEAQTEAQQPALTADTCFQHFGHVMCVYGFRNLISRHGCEVAFLCCDVAAVVLFCRCSRGVPPLSFCEHSTVSVGSSFNEQRTSAGESSR